MWLYQLFQNPFSVIIRGQTFCRRLLVNRQLVDCPWQG